MESLFELVAVSLDRPGPDGKVRRILDAISLTIPATGITCLAGPSGSGKSTLLRLLNRLEEPTRGRIRYRGTDLTALEPSALRRRVGLVSQSPVMLPGSVRENLEAGLRLHHKRLADPERWLGRLGLPVSLLEQPARDLSGGEKQRLALARTLVTGPEALLLDEVTASLDPESVRVVEQLILEAGLPAVMVSHDPAQAQRMGARSLRLEEGRLQEVAPA